MAQADRQSIVILTGAGISKESGLDTFRDPDGIWSQVDLADVATPEAFARDPDRVHAFYNHRRAGLLDARVQPNEAHRALARLERDWPGTVLLVTQNIDDLHERGGSAAPVHMHGEILKARCQDCGTVSAWRESLSTESHCPACRLSATLRVDVIWFGEVPYHLEQIFATLSRCDLFISIGTSGNVYPAAGFVQEARGIGHAHTVELNLEPSEGHNLFAERRYGPASELVPAFVDEILSEGWAPRD